MSAEDYGSLSGSHALTNSKPEIATSTHALLIALWDGGQAGALVIKTVEVVLKQEHEEY